MENKSVNKFGIQLGARIKRARVARGLSLRDAALQIGISHTELKNLEEGKRAPKSDLLLKMAKLYRVRTEYFYRAVTLEIKEEQICHRGRHKLTEKDIEKIKALLSDRGEQVIELLQYYETSPFSNDYSAKFKDRKITALEDIDQFASDVRQAWSLGLNPIDDLIDSIEKVGIFIFSADIHDSDFDGFSCVIEQSPFIVINDNQVAVRKRFSIAHELGHILLEQFKMPKLDIEQACNRFAAAFLLPKESVFSFIGENRSSINCLELKNMAEEFGVSIESALYRLATLKIINNKTLDEIKNNLDQRGLLKNDFAKVFMKKPRLLEQLILRGLEENYYNESKAAQFLGKTLAEFRDMMAS